ncbi:hypothetical protein cyc_04600 [Cyclospora cayetanensis]|uniref:Uncharacterized protein n=1 Tax=Cyclospora cayetanensis TaxID=88456 RepID=A0A1D3D4B2_9EIME|nr:hypothetical protein cyc_04600 [Cyclospora cayetanensis]
MWRDLWLVGVVIIVFLLCLMQFEMHDTRAFTCILKEEKNRKTAPTFVPVEDSPPAYVARGTMACVEDVVTFANTRRAGPDGIVGTEDDTLTIEEHLDLLGASLEANFVGGYWAYSPFFVSYEHYGSAVRTQLLMADVDEMLLLRVLPAGSSIVINSGKQERYILPLEGTLNVSREAPLRPLMLQPTVPSAFQELSASTPVQANYLRLKAGRKVLLGSTLCNNQHFGDLQEYSQERCGASLPPVVGRRRDSPLAWSRRPVREAATEG